MARAKEKDSGRGRGCQHPVRFGVTRLLRPFAANRVDEGAIHLLPAGSWGYLGTYAAAVFLAHVQIIVGRPGGGRGDGEDAGDYEGVCEQAMDHDIVLIIGGG